MARTRRIGGFGPSGGGFLPPGGGFVPPTRSKPKAKPSPARKHMELAVAVMKQSIAEGRGDGKATPLVGAVLVKSDGSIETAHRGELREGDHAEFTLLERKNRDARLDGAQLFATLEPCAPGARNAPKLSCAERIVNARIKEVWIGIEDPDPKVDRKGIKFLQDNGVAVHLFDRDLQEQIRKVNATFIEQAEVRAQTAAHGPKSIVLSDLEAGIPKARLDELSSKALDQYRKTIRVAGRVGGDAFQQRLVAHGLLEDRGGNLVPTGFGLILFGTEPRVRLQQAGLLGTIHYDDGTEETRDFDGPAVLVPDQVIDWIKNKTPVPIDRSRANRDETSNALFELIREGVVNALVHRDYSIKGAKCQLRVTPHSVTIVSPGHPVTPITLEQLQSFDAPMLSRNPLLHYVFLRMGLAEERGLGLSTMKAQATKAKIPTPRYLWRDPYVELAIYRSAKAAVQATDRNLLSLMTAAEREGWAWLVDKDAVTTGEYIEALGIPQRSAERHLQRFTEIGLIKRTGRGRATRYEVDRR